MKLDVPTTKKVVLLANNKWVEDFQYSQGHFDVVETDDVLKAQDFTPILHCFDTFFKPRNAQLLTVQFTATLVD